MGALVHLGRKGPSPHDGHDRPGNHPWSAEELVTRSRPAAGTAAPRSDRSGRAGLARTNHPVAQPRDHDRLDGTLAPALLHGLAQPRVQEVREADRKDLTHGFGAIRAPSATASWPD